MKIEILLEPTSNITAVDSLNLPDHRIHKDGDDDAPFQLESDSLPHAHCNLQLHSISSDSRIMKAQVLKTKTSAKNLLYKISFKISSLLGRLFASFQDDAKYEHVGQRHKICKGGKVDSR
ncbi:hypothetical protein Tco_0412729 [Tanacetum coccineum]